MSEQKINIAVIPARGGSKRIPKKNIRLFYGKPIMAWSIEAALNSGLFDHVIVSTDDDEIAKIAQKFGAETPFVRPKELSDDFTGTNDVVKHGVQWCLEQNIAIDKVCCLYATAPFIRTDDLKQSFRQLEQSQKEFVFSVTHYDFPIQRAISQTKHEGVSPVFADKINERSQDLDEVYHDAGQFYWGKAEAFLQDVDLYSEHSELYILPNYLVQDIDTEDDWKRAELMFRALNSIED